MINIFLTKIRRKIKGFTLLEVLLAIGMLSILMSVTIIAINPGKQIQSMRNSKRMSDVKMILQAMATYSINHGGELPAEISVDEKQIGTCMSGGSDPCTGAAPDCIDIMSIIDMEYYLAEMPIDPLSEDPSKSFYSISRDANGIMTVRACNAELGEIIQVSR